MSQSKHILVIRLSAMGDVAMTVNILRAFTTQYPNVKLTVLTRGFFTPFFRDLKNVSVFNADVKGKHKGVLGLFKLSKELKSLGIDAVADLHNVLRSKILNSFLFGIKTEQIDKGRAEKKALIAKDNFKQLKTTHQRYADVFERLGYPIDILKPTFPERKTLKESTLKKVGTDALKWIGIAPFAAFEGKMYPLDLMENVIENLSKIHKIILFGGGNKEVAILNTFQDKYKNVVNVAGQLTLNEELDVISNLDMMLSMDSGNAHIAAMLGIKVITVWGITHPFAGFAPFNQPENFTLLADAKIYPLIPTSIYGNKCPETYLKAAGSIAPDVVIAKIKAVI